MNISGLPVYRHVLRRICAPDRRARCSQSGPRRNLSIFTRARSRVLASREQAGRRAGGCRRASSGASRARAKARGVHIGRPHKLTPHQRQEGFKASRCRRNPDGSHLWRRAHHDRAAVRLATAARDSPVRSAPQRRPWRMASGFAGRRKQSNDKGCDWAENGAQPIPKDS